MLFIQQNIWWSTCSRSLWWGWRCRWGWSPTRWGKGSSAASSPGSGTATRSYNWSDFCRFVDAIFSSEFDTKNTLMQDFIHQQKTSKCLNSWFFTQGWKNWHVEHVTNIRYACGSGLRTLTTLELERGCASFAHSVSVDQLTFPPTQWLERNRFIGLWNWGSFLPIWVDLFRSSMQSSMQSNDSKPIYIFLLFYRNVGRPEMYCMYMGEFSPVSLIFFQSTGLWGNSRLCHLINALTYHLINLPSLLQINSKSFKRMCVPGIASCQKKFGPKYGFFAELGSMAYANMRPTASGSLFLVLVGPEKGLGVHFFSLLRLF